MTKKEIAWRWLTENKKRNGWKAKFSIARQKIKNHVQIEEKQSVTMMEKGFQHKFSLFCVRLVSLYFLYYMLYVGWLVGWFVGLLICACGLIEFASGWLIYTGKRHVLRATWRWKKKNVRKKPLNVQLKNTVSCSW